MKIAVDIDGVLVDFFTPFNNLVEKVFGLRLYKRNWKQYDIGAKLGLPAASVKSLVTITIKSPGMLPVPGSIENIRRLVKDGHEVYLVTTRPRATLSATERWLERWKVPHSALIRCEPLQKYRVRTGKLFWKKRFDVFVEDNLREALLLVEDGTPTVIYAQPYNHTYNLRGLLKRVGTWAEVRKVIGNV